jgi:hypothetical protein
MDREREVHDMILDPILLELDAAQDSLRALRSAFETTAPGFIMPSGEAAAPIKARASDAVRALRGLADVLVSDLGLTEGRGRL